MPEFASRELAVALDMRGCPNRCRHCYLGTQPNGNMTEDDLRWAVDRFRSYVRKGENKPFIENLRVSSWVREPDFSEDYRRLAELEAELGCGEANRFELHSIWRLARDPGYAEWAKSIGPDTCQITFFGMEETQDWFYRREGAFRDCIKATERLLMVGMKPRWQFFLTKKILPDLDELMRLVNNMRLRERVQELGSEFSIFIHDPGLEGEGRKLYDLCAEIEDVKYIPKILIESTAKHSGCKELVWRTEADRIDEILSSRKDETPELSYYDRLYFLINKDWDVFSNMATMDPWWKLGNLKTDPIETIFENFELDRSLGMRIARSVGIKELAKRYGNPESKRIADVVPYWRERYCAGIYRCMAQEGLIHS